MVSTSPIMNAWKEWEAEKEGYWKEWQRKLLLVQNKQLVDASYKKSGEDDLDEALKAEAAGTKTVNNVAKLALSKRVDVENALFTSTANLTDSVARFQLQSLKSDLMTQLLEATKQLSEAHKAKMSSTREEDAVFYHDTISSLQTIIAQLRASLSSLEPTETSASTPPSHRKRPYEPEQDEDLASGAAKRRSPLSQADESTYRAPTVLLDSSADDEDDEVMRTVLARSVQETSIYSSSSHSGVA